MAVLDDAHRTNINWDSFFFSSAQAKAAFDAAPFQYVERLTDPVTRVRFSPTAKTAYALHEGKQFYFSSKATWDTFSAEPDKYAQVNIGMKENRPKH